MKLTLESLDQPELVVVRRLSAGPLTEFELGVEVAEHSSYPPELVAERMPGWLQGLREKGLVWAGHLWNKRGQLIMAAALTSRGRDLVA